MFYYLCIIVKWYSLSNKSGILTLHLELWDLYVWKYTLNVLFVKWSGRDYLDKFSKMIKNDKRNLDKVILIDNYLNKII